MKAVIALLFVAVAVSHAQLLQLAAPHYTGITAAHHLPTAYAAAPYAAHYAAPYAAAIGTYQVPAPLAYASHAHLAGPAVVAAHHGPAAVVAAHHAPAAVVAAPAAIQGGYVAATRGSVHTAPLPAGSAAIASHHINTAPAPGTL
jgi:hypothetical protein